MSNRSSAEIRDGLGEALEADLIGPYDLKGDSTEELPLAPSRWYLTGFLAPQAATEQEDPTQDDELASGDDEDDDEAQSEPATPEPKQKRMLPASLGLSVLLPAGDELDEIEVMVAWADYVLTTIEPTEEHPTRPLSPAARQTWRRKPRNPNLLRLKLDAVSLAAGVEIPDAGGVWVVGQLGAAPRAHGLPDGTRALAVFVVNRREPGERGRLDERFMFQVQLKLRFERGLVGRANQRGQDSDDWDERVLDLQFRNSVEYAVGHGVAAEWSQAEGVVRIARSSWLPRAEVLRVVTSPAGEVTTSMEVLGGLADGASARSALGSLPGAYATWIRQQQASSLDGEERRATRDALMDRAERAQGRIEEGIALLERDPVALRAFSLANRAMAMASRKRSPERGEPQWRLFQLAFFLLNLPALVDPAHSDRATVELIFFPTGGGKTEAYLGTIAFSLIHRRLLGSERPDAGLGVAVLLRYTLRLLTLDQLGRAATLICALERLRHELPELGAARFAVGLWVGRSATANTMTEVARWITDYRAAVPRTARSPFPLAACPWCGSAFAPASFNLHPRTNPERVVVGCNNFRCEFALANETEGVPVLFVDEQIYRELPSFLIATVDKFALLPWRGETGMLFGHALARDGRRFYGPGDDVPREATAVPEGLLPPELIVQDELHLISGPLGTMVGLYETAIETLCRRRTAQGDRPAKILASTATVRRAGPQIAALFGRNEVAMFPPPGIDDGESFFARVDRNAPGRRYLGVAAQGKAMKAILLRTYVALLCASQRHLGSRSDLDDPADPYMTLVGYFNSLRELGGMRRLVEDEVRSRAAQKADRLPLGFRGDTRFANRNLNEPLELTSRERTSEIAKTKDKLAKPHAEGGVDVLLASNMISVGVDIERLGLMVMGGQPKSTSEYIQASSRVGRRASWPGLVVTVYNVHKPRDRSHYERFAAYHACFYRFVEATSVTPFSGPALDRGLAGAVVALTRLSDPLLTPPTGVMELRQRREVGDRAAAVFAQRAGALQRNTQDQQSATTALAQRIRSLLDSWERIVARTRDEAAGQSCYSPWDRPRVGKPLLFQALDDKSTRDTDELKFQAPSSMRDVEPSVHLWIVRRPPTKKAKPDAT